MPMTAIDQVQLAFNPDALTFINIMLALVMFGVALDLRVAAFIRVLRYPKAPAIGLFCQFLAMPALACLLVYLIQPTPSIALGIILVAACPGGNVSNFLTNLGRGSTEVSVSMSSISTVAAIIMTPLNFTFWARVDPYTRGLLESISLSPFDILTTVLTILVLPTFLGMLCAHFRPGFAARIRKPMQIFSLLVLASFIVGALYVNFDYFLAYVGTAFWIVLAVNGCGLILGYQMARLVGTSRADAKAVSFETGIQNSGFGLVLVFQFFGGLGGMAIVAAWWGVWHLLSGLTLALFWAWRSRVAVAQHASKPDCPGERPVQRL